MAHSVTLGGDRLGSGKKQRIELHGYERSTHDLGNLWRTTMSPGTLVPFMVRVALPGDTWDINLGCDVKTHPTIGPLFGSYKVQLDVFQCPIRLYQGLLHNNKLGIGMRMSEIKLPQMTLDCLAIPGDTEDKDNAQINPSCILAYIGIRGVGSQTGGNTTRDFNALAILMYWDIYKNYYSNKQEEIGAVIHKELVTLVNTVTGIKIDGVTVPTGSATPVPLTTGSIVEVTFAGTTPLLDQILFKTTAGTLSLQQIARPTSIVTTVTTITFEYNFAQYGDIVASEWVYISLTDIPATAPEVVTFPLENLDTMREEILKQMDTSPVIINQITGAPLAPYDYLFEKNATQIAMMNTQEGLAIKTYQSDLFNNWLSTEWLDGTGGINEITAIDTTGGSFTIDTLILSKKVYNMLNRIAVSGGTYNDWIDANWDNDPYMRAESPIYQGGLSKELVFQEVVSNSSGSSADTGGQPLGTLAGKGTMASKHKGGSVRIKVDEPSYIMGIVSLTPRIDYSQGNAWDINLKTMDDLHKPALDEIGFQELITEQMGWWTTTVDLAGNPTFKSAGKQPAWINYMTSVNQVYGNFAIRNNEMFMTLTRRYENIGSGTIEDLTTYIDPVKYNQIFAQTSIDAMNFWVQIAIDATVRRKMSAKVMPNL